MIIEHKENISSDFYGTIIDIEFIGNFNRFYSIDDARRYEDTKLIIFGFMNKEFLHIHCAKGIEGIAELYVKTGEIMDSLEKPLLALAFHCDVTSGVLFHALGFNVSIYGELARNSAERKADVVKELNISNYDDPFFGDGFACSQAWMNSQFNEAIAHNRACLLTERDILIKRHYKQVLIQPF